MSGKCKVHSAECEVKAHLTRCPHPQPLSHPMGEGHYDLLTQDEVAARLKVGERTLLRLQNDGVVPFILLGKSVRFYWPAIIAHLIANFTVTRCVPHGPPGENLKRGNRESEIALPHPGPLPPAAAGRRWSLIAKGVTP